MSWMMTGQLLLLVAGLFVGLPLIGSALISVITTQTNQQLMQVFGRKAPIIFGWLGIMVHEGSHALVAILFGHHVDHIRWIQNPFTANQDERLGYVSHGWNPHNKIQQAGNFFIGLAPMFGVVLVGFLVTLGLWPQMLTAYQTGASIWHQVTWWQLVIWLYVITNLSLALNLSRADWQNIKAGLGWYIVFVSLLFIGLRIAHVSVTVLWQTIGIPLSLFFGMVLATTFIGYLLTVLLLKFRPNK